ncbi:MAG: DUF1934 domain-containing protein [Oscillospiraceae bacterium]|nr:DUF1934 domain-containing protein [Oscillospiraceae bacterium]
MRAVTITVIGKQAQPDGSDEDTIELVTEGRYEKGPDGIAISYVESELTGFAGCTTTFTVKPDCITMNRFGSECGDMVFEVGKRHQYFYATEAGNLLLGVNTLSVHKQLNEQGGELAISYLLDFDDRVFSRNSFTISIK